MTTIKADLGESGFEDSQHSAIIGRSWADDIMKINADR
jgi:hypothetical protein